MQPGRAWAWLVAGLLFPAWVQAAVAPAGQQASADGSCPPPLRVEPAYPADMVQSQREGEVLLALAVDGCGRVTAAEVRRGSGQPALDAAALEAARQWVLAEDARLPAGDGRVLVPVAFRIPPAKAHAYGGPDWPESHRRVRYVAEPLEGYATPTEILDRYPLDPEAMITPPYPRLRSMFFRQRSADPREYWLFLYLQGRPAVAARYRLVHEGGEPLVRVAILCDNTESACKRDGRLLMRGLPFAKAR